MPNAYRVRTAGANDLNDLVRMRRAIQAHIESTNPSILEVSRAGRKGFAESFRSLIDDADARIFVTHDPESSTAVGMAACRIRRFEDLKAQRVGWIENVWVDPRHRRRGVASLMLKEIVRFFRRHSLEIVTLDYVSGDVGAESLWASLGFGPSLILANARLKGIEEALLENEVRRSR